MIGRLRPGASLDQARADLNRIAAGFAAIDPTYHDATTVAVEPLAGFIVDNAREVLLVLLGAATMVLLIACANIAGLLLARAASRRREMDVRGALGATGGRLVRQLLAEGLVLASPGTVLGLAGGFALVRLFVASMPAAQRASLPHLESLALHPAVVVTVVGISVLAALLFGAAPAWRLRATASRADLRGIVGFDRRRGRAQTALVVAQIALTLVLFVGAGLMGRTVARLTAVSPGFSTDGLLTMRTNLTGERYAGDDSVLAFHRDLLERLSALPGVTGVSTIDQAPLTGRGNSGTFVVESAPGIEERETQIRTVAANYFDVMGIPMQSGRPFAATDRIGSPLVLLVNETFARRFFDGRPVGERIAFPFFDGRPFWEIVGVVGDEQVAGIDGEMLPVAYFAYAQSAGNGFSLMMRTVSAPESAIAETRRVLSDMEPNAPLFAAQSMTTILRTSSAVYRRQTVLALVGTFAAAGLVLTMVGLYGLVSQAVSARTREIGVRLTLGARPDQVVSSVARGGLTPALVGLVVGLGLSALATRSLQGLLFGVESTDPLTLGVVVATLGLVAGVACFVPASRALRIDPVEALRRE